MYRAILAILACLILAGCDLPLSSATPAVPTVASLEMVQTSVALTQNAPPPGFTQVAFPQIDGNLNKHPGWHYTVQLSFDGVLADTSQAAQGSIAADVYSNELTGDRRVLLKASGEAFGLSEERDVEGVRVGNDYYLVDSNKVCTKIQAPTTEKQVADLAAGALIGGVKQATPSGHRKTDNNADVWEYSFSPDSVVVPPAVQVGADGKITVAAGDLWIVPAYNAVWQYTVTFDVTKVIAQGSHPLTGKLRADYQLVEADVQYNISIPFGC